MFAAYGGWATDNQIIDVDLQFILLKKTYQLAVGAIVVDLAVLTQTNLTSWTGCLGQMEQRSVPNLKWTSEGCFEQRVAMMQQHSGAPE